MEQQPNNPLHGKTLENILIELYDHYGWVGLGIKFRMNCFRTDPSIKSCLKFLRKNEWARRKIEDEYLWISRKKKKKETLGKKINPDL